MLANIRGTNGFVLGGLLFAMGAPAFAQSYAITDLCPIGEQRCSAVAINNAGQIVVQVRNLKGESHTVLYEKGGMTDLGSFGGKITQGYRVNALGEVVGFSETAEGKYRAFRYANGALREIDTTDTRLSIATGINRFGHVAGYIQLDDHVTSGVLHEGDATTDLGTVGGARMDIIDINDARQLVGHQYPHHHGSYRRGYVYQNGTIRFLNTWGGEAITVTDINEAGHVVGHSATARGNLKAFVFDGTRMHSLDSLSAEGQSLAFGINNPGQIVGGVDSSGTGLRAFIYDRAVVRDLNELLPQGSEWTLVTARAINDRGEIVGDGILRGEQHAFLLTPPR